MSLIEYLLIGFVAFMVIGGSITFVALRRAVDGCEDVLGFHLGDRPMVARRTPAPVAPPRAVIPLSMQSVSATVAGSGHPFMLQTSTDTNAPFAPASVMTTVSGREATVSPLYRRHHRPSRSPFAAGSGSPFPAVASGSPFDAARVPAGPAISNNPFEAKPEQRTPGPKG